VTDTETLIEQTRSQIADLPSWHDSGYTVAEIEVLLAALAAEKERADAAEQDQRAFDDYREQYLQLCLRLEAAEAQVAAEKERADTEAHERKQALVSAHNWELQAEDEHEARTRAEAQVAAEKERADNAEHGRELARLDVENERRLAEAQVEEIAQQRDRYQNTASEALAQVAALQKALTEHHAVGVMDNALIGNKCPICKEVN